MVVTPIVYMETNIMTETQIAEIYKEIEQSKATRQRVEQRIAKMKEHWI